MSLPLEPQSCGLFWRISMWFYTKDRSEAMLLGEQQPLPASHCPGFWSPKGPGYPRAPGAASSILRPPGDTGQFCSATQRPTAPVGRESFCLSLGFGGLLDSGWYFGGLDVCLTKLYLEKVISYCMAVPSVPLELVSCSCIPTSGAHTYSYCDMGSSRGNPGVASKPLVLIKKMKQEIKSCNIPMCKSCSVDEIQIAFPTKWSGETTSVGAGMDT